MDLLIVREDEDSSKFTREDFIYLAKMSEQCERFDEMLGFVRKFSSMSDALLTPDERHVFSVAYKNAVGNRRAELRVLTVVEQKEQRKHNINDDSIQQIARYRSLIEAELVKLCNEVTAFIDDKMLPLSKNPNNEIYFKKMKGDYLRYLAEFMDEEDCTDIVRHALKAYEAAEKLAKNNLPPTHPLRLGLLLNLSVFYYEVLQEPGTAVKIASGALDEAFASIDKIKEENFKESTLIMQLLRDNLTLWSSEIPGAESQQDDQ